MCIRDSPHALVVKHTEALGGVSAGALLTALTSAPHTCGGGVTVGDGVELVTVAVANTQLPIPATLGIAHTASGVSILKNALNHASVEANVTHGVIEADTGMVEVAVKAAGAWALIPHATEVPITALRGGVLNITYLPALILGGLIPHAPVIGVTLDLVLFGGALAMTDIVQPLTPWVSNCLLYTSDAADDLLCVDLGGRRIIKKKKKIYVL
eukprot:TRINITY_DN9854_c0_g1_i1.p1 TRINITY_DN9854_c0_g1~~TRINITY_DN9854_c0_g1_i1.p1  ORF type:complete len:212 (-),score=46.99 TRINITY_DN9854_c0_g1_i1:50-685(-)